MLRIDCKSWALLDEVGEISEIRALGSFSGRFTALLFGSSFKEA